MGYGRAAGRGAARNRAALALGSRRRWMRRRVELHGRATRPAELHAAAVGSSHAADHHCDGRFVDEYDSETDDGRQRNTVLMTNTASILTYYLSPLHHLPTIHAIHPRPPLNSYKLINLLWRGTSHQWPSPGARLRRLSARTHGAGAHNKRRPGHYPRRFLLGH